MSQLALVNGAPVTGHSITFATLSEFECIAQILIVPDAPPFGSEIEVEQPTSVNVIVEPSLDGKPLSSTKKAQLEVLEQISIVPGDRIVTPALLQCPVHLAKTTTSSPTQLVTSFHPLLLQRFGMFSI